MECVEHMKVIQIEREGCVGDRTNRIEAQLQVDVRENAGTRRSIDQYMQKIIEERTLLKLVRTCI